MSSMARTDDCFFKIVLVGYENIGKTCVINRFLNKDFKQTLATIGASFILKTIELNGEKIKLEIWDTCGLDCFIKCIAPHCKGAKGFMVLYDITNEYSFEKTKDWMKAIEEHASADVEKMLLGNKCDLDKDRKVSKESGEMLAQEYGIKFMETSAKSSINVENAFLTLARDIKSKIVSKMETDSHQNSSTEVPQRETSCSLF